MASQSADAVAAEPMTTSTTATAAAAVAGSPFHDLIGSCFKPYLDIYTDSIDRSLADILERFVADARTHASATGAPTPPSSSSSAVQVAPLDGTGAAAGLADSPVYPSCADLFVFYKKCMVQCAQLSCGQPLLDLTAIFKRYLREYASRLLEPNLQAPAAVGSGSGECGWLGIIVYSGAGYPGPSQISNIQFVLLVYQNLRFIEGLTI